jgi:hypothetical protein
LDIHADSISKLLVAQFHLFFRMLHLLLFLSDVSKKRKHIIAPPFITIVQLTVTKSNKNPHAQILVEESVRISIIRNNHSKGRFLIPILSRNEVKINGN